MARKNGSTGFFLNLPEELNKGLEEMAAENCRKKNAHIVFILKKAVEKHSNGSKKNKDAPGNT